VVIVSAVMPYPKDAGKKVVLAGLLDYWVDRVGPEHVHYVLVDEPTGQHPPIPAQVHRIVRPTSGEQILHLAQRSVVRRRHAFQESMLYSRRTRDELRRVLGSIAADVEIYDTVRLAQYAAEIVRRRGQVRVAYLDDLFSVRYARMLTLLRSPTQQRLDPLGEFRRWMPRPMARLLDVPRAQRVVLEAERRLISRREIETAREFDASLLVSPAEVASLSAQPGVNAVEAVPPVIAASTMVRRYTTPPEFVFLGLLSLPHNHDAVTSFLRQCMPDVLRRLPDARLRIVGRGARPELLAAAAPFADTVRIEGYVPDLADLLSRACAMLVPLRFGSGIKIKVLEALAHGVPVVATPVGAEGVATGPDNGVLVEADLRRVPAVMAHVADDNRNADLSEAARRHYLSYYSRSAAFRRYDEVFGAAWAQWHGATTGKPVDTSRRGAG